VPVQFYHHTVVLQREGNCNVEGLQGPYPFLACDVVGDWLAPC
jgi:hypothetical protein